MRFHYTLDGVMFWCPACKCAHGGSKWKETGNQTLNSSVLIRGYLFTDDKGEPIYGVCHVSVINGMLIYHDDTTHEMKGQKVPMVKWPEEIQG